MNIEFIRVLLESESPNLGDTLVAIFAATATTADFPASGGQPASFTDTNGNVFTNVFYSANNANDIAGFNMMAVYVCNRCAAGDTIIDIPAGLLPGDVIRTWQIVYEFAAAFAAFNLGVSLVKTGQTANFNIAPGNAQINSIILAGVFDAAVTGTPEFATAPEFTVTQNTLDDSVSGTLTGSTGQLALNLVGGSIQQDVHVNAATDVFGFVLAITGANNISIAPSGKFIFGINKGPVPQPTREGREIATVQIDCTTIPTNVDISDNLSNILYPELVVLNSATLGDPVPIKYAIVQEFDLEFINRSAGLSQVRHLIAYSRPMYNPALSSPVIPATDVPFDPEFVPTNYYCGISLLTNLSTLQTVVLGAKALMEAIKQASVTDDFGAVFVEQMQVPFPANKGSLKFRFINLTSTTDFGQVGMGKFTLLFTNFELPSSFIEVGALAITGYGD